MIREYSGLELYILVHKLSPNSTMNLGDCLGDGDFSLCANEPTTSMLFPNGKAIADKMPDYINRFSTKP